MNFIGVTLFVLFSIIGILSTMKDLPGTFSIMFGILFFDYFNPDLALSWTLYIMLVSIVGISEFLDIFSVPLSEKKKIKIVKVLLNFLMILLFLVCCYN